MLSSFMSSFSRAICLSSVSQSFPCFAYSAASEVVLFASRFSCAVASFEGSTCRLIGKDALREDRFPVAAFWRNAFHDDGLYDVFEKAVKDNPDRCKRMKPEQLKSLILAEKDKLLLRSVNKKADD